MVAAFSKQSGIGIYSCRLCDALGKYVTVERVDLSFKDKWCALFGVFKHWGDLKGACKNNDVVHVQFHLGEYMFFFFPLLFLARRKNQFCKIVLTLHEDEQNLPVVVRWFNYFWYCFADKLITHTLPHANGLPSFLFRKNPIACIGMGCEVRDAPKNLKVEKFWLFLPGFVNRWKGHDLAINALYVLREIWGFKEARLIFVGKVGDRNFFDEIKRLAVDKGVDEFIYWHVGDFASDELYEDFMQRCGIVLLPYRRITMSAVAGEALGWGKVVVCSDLPAFKDYFTDNFPYHTIGHPGDLAFNIRLVWEKKYNDLRKESCWLREIYSWPTTAHTTNELYQNT